MVAESAMYEKVPCNEATLPQLVKLELEAAQRMLLEHHERILCLALAVDFGAATATGISREPSKESSRHSHDDDLPQDRPAQESSASPSPCVVPTVCASPLGPGTRSPRSSLTSTPVKVKQLIQEEEPSHATGDAQVNGHCTPSTPRTPRLLTNGRHSPGLPTETSLPTIVSNDNFAFTNGDVKQESKRSPDVSDHKKVVSRKSILALSDDATCHKTSEAASKTREQVMINLEIKGYNVHDFYKTSGVAQKVARHYIFENLTMLVILINALWIAVDTDLNHAAMLLDAHPAFQIAEHAFCFYFSIEWAMRFLAFKRKRNCLRDSWFVFDTFLVATMVLETWVMTVFILVAAGSSGTGGLGNASILRIARLLRLSRTARMARLLRNFPELVILVKGMVASMRSVLTTLFMLVILLYIFGIAFVQLTLGTPVGNDRFPTVLASMAQLLFYGVLCLDYAEDISYELGSVHIFYPCVYFLFVLIGALTVMNMLIGVLCEIVSEVAKREKETLIEDYAKEKLLVIMDTLDKDNNKRISKYEFLSLMEEREACRALQQIGVDVIGLVDFADVIFETDADATEDVELTFEEFLGLVMQLRGEKLVTVKDLVDFRQLLQSEIAGLKQDIAKAQARPKTSWNEVLLAPTGKSPVRSRPPFVYSRGSSDEFSKMTQESDCPSVRLDELNSVTDSRQDVPVDSWRVVI